MIEGQTGRPTIEGFYACDTDVNGWRVLEWYQGAWWHHRNVARWMASDPVRWVGPLPTREKPKATFDL